MSEITLYCVYAHECPIQNKVKYIGMGRRSRAYNINRKQCHKEYSEWVLFLEKMNLEPNVIILENNLSKNEAFNLEIKYIEEYKNSGNILFNKTLGGNGFRSKHNSKTKDLISKIHKGRISPMKGKSLSIETKLKISATNKGRFLGGGFAKGHELSNRKKVIDLESGIVFESAREAANAKCIGLSCLGAQLRGQNPNKTFLRYLNEVCFESSINP